MFARLLAPLSAMGPHWAIALAAAQFISMIQPGSARGLPLIYFTQDGSSVNAVNRIDASGGSVETIQGTGLTRPAGVDLDLTAGKVYWADASQGILRKNLDGSGSVETLISGDLSPFDIALDVEDGKIYF